MLLFFPFPFSFFNPKITLPLLINIGKFWDVSAGDPMADLSGLGVCPLEAPVSASLIPAEWFEQFFEQHIGDAERCSISRAVAPCHFSAAYSFFVLDVVGKTEATDIHGEYSLACNNCCRRAAVVLKSSCLNNDFMEAYVAAVGNFTHGFHFVGLLNEASAKSRLWLESCLDEGFSPLPALGISWSVFAMTIFLRPTAWFGNLSGSNTDPFVTGKVALAHMSAALEPLLGKRTALIYSNVAQNMCKKTKL